MKTILSRIGGTELSISAIFTAVVAVFNKVPTLLILFMVAVVIDYLTGWAKAAFFLKEWNSKTGLQGIIKKTMYFVTIGTAFLIAYAIKEIGAQAGFDLGFALYLGWYTVAVMLINELTSILENLYVMIPDMVPVWLVKALKICDDTLEHKINDIICKNQECDTCELKDSCPEAKTKEG